MKLITLNTWGGRVGDKFASFIKEKSNVIDIFCFQEVYHRADGKFANVKWVDNGTNTQLFDHLKKLLPNYVGIFRPHFEDFWGLAFFIKKDIPIITEGEKFVYYKESVEEERKGKTSKNVQYVLTEVNGKKVTIVNFHGLYNGNGKTDSESRIAQSKEIVSFLKDAEGEIVFCGDFNLRPDTQSIKIIEDFGLKNLIKEYDVKATRTSLYKKEEKFADYIFLSNGIVVNKFEVLSDEVSDHNAIQLDFDVINS